MAIKVHTCPNTWIHGGHPCWKVLKAVRDSGMPYEQVKEPLLRGRRTNVKEHTGQNRLPALERAVFAAARPASVVVTTPNVEYNVRFDNLPAGAFRHADHRFEWTRAQFREWADGVADRHGYAVKYLSVGQEDPEVGPPTQLAVFTTTEVS